MVAQANPEAAVILSHRQLQRAVVCRGRVSTRIVDEIEQNLLDDGRIGLHAAFQHAVGRLDRQGQLGVRGAIGQPLGGHVKQFADADRGRPFDPAPLQSGVRQHVGHEMCQPLSLDAKRVRK